MLNGPNQMVKRAVSNPETTLFANALNISRLQSALRALAFHCVPASPPPWGCNLCHGLSRRESFSMHQRNTSASITERNSAWNTMGVSGIHDSPSSQAKP